MHRFNGCVSRQHESPTDDFLSPDDWEQLRTWLALSPRELRIVQLVFFDCTEREMASQLDISPHTVHTHLKRVYQKLSVSGRVEVVVRVFATYVAITPRSL